MRKIIFSTMLLTLSMPITTLADNSEILNTQQEEVDNKPTKSFVEFGVAILNNVETNLEIEAEKFYTQEALSMNTGGFFTIGTEIHGIQLGVSPQYIEIDSNSSQSIIHFKLDIPFGHDFIQPFLSVGTTMNWLNVDIDEETITDFTLGFKFGGGLKINFYEELFVKIGFTYGYTEFKKDYYGYNINLTDKGFNIFTAIGYVF